MEGRAFNKLETLKNAVPGIIIDHFKVNAAMSPGVQTYWDERAAKH